MNVDDHPATASRYGIRGTVALNSEVCDDYPPIIEEAVRLKWEFMGHNQSNSRLLNEIPPDTEQQVIRDVLKRIEAHRFPAQVNDATRLYFQNAAQITAGEAGEAMARLAKNPQDTAAAEDATGYRWGEPRLARHVRRIQRDAEAAGDERLEQLASRFLG